MQTSAGNGSSLPVQSMCNKINDMAIYLQFITTEKHTQAVLQSIVCAMVGFCRKQEV